jgi:transposase
MLRVDQVHVVRHKVLVEGRSQRRVAKELGIARDTVRKYLTESIPIRKETHPRSRPVWDAVRERVEGLLTESVQWTGGKQRLTATRLHELLVAEGHRVGVTLVKEAVAEWKRQRREVFVPLTYRPGDLGEVDFFRGAGRRRWRPAQGVVVLMRLMYSGRDFAWICERQDQISFLDGHVRAFAHFGGVPARLAYDNLRAAVGRILVGGERALTARFPESGMTTPTITRDLIIAHTRALKLPASPASLTASPARRATRIGRTRTTCTRSSAPSKRPVTNRSSASDSARRAFPR